MGLQESQVVIERGEGNYVETSDGTRLLDATSGLWYANLGHAHPDLVGAASRQIAQLETFQLWGGFVNRPAAELTTRLVAKHAPFPDAKVMLGSGGSDATEMAMRLVRLHWARRGMPDRRVVLSRNSAYHGLHSFGTSLHGSPEVRSAFGAGGLVGDTGWIDRDDIDAVRAEIETIGPDRVAAIVAEPIIGSGGVHPPKPGYLSGLRALCDEFGILLVFDEVITGFGRAGAWFASDRYDVVPDLTLFAKGITCGYVPLGGVFVSRSIWEPFFERGSDALYPFGVTYAGHATACAVAMTTLDVIERDDLLRRVGELETHLHGALPALASLPVVHDVRGEGLMAGIELGDAELVQTAIVRLREQHRTIVRAAGGTALAISPTFLSTTEELDAIVAALDAVLTQLRPNEPAR